MAPSANLICDRPLGQVRVVRFARPDLRPVLYDGEPVRECTLYRELRAAAVADLGPGDALVLNFGLVEWFPSIFFAALLDLRREVAARQAKLMLCGLPPSVREPFDVMGGGKLFEVRATEARAVADAAK